VASSSEGMIAMLGLWGVGGICVPGYLRT
jgi:hypothetical protein